MKEPVTITTRSTSRSSAIAEDIIFDEIILKDNQTFRLVFHPEIVENPHDKDACVRGTFFYQRKINGQWYDHKTLDLSRLKSGEWIKLELKAGDLKKLTEGIKKNSAIFKKYGVQLGSNKYVFTSEELGSFINQLTNDRSFAKSFVEKGGDKILSIVLEWMTKTKDAERIIIKLQNLEAQDLEKVSNIVGIAKIKKVLKLWEENKTNDDEEFWQITLKENSWLISQLFATPVVIFKDKAYVGGKNIDNKDGRVVDFIFSNSITSTISLIEIKTPMKPLINTTEYRDNVFLVSKDVNGGTIQVLGQKDSLLKEYNILNSNSDKKFNACNPRCILITGSFENIPLTAPQRESFDLYRSHIQGVEIITYDELFKKTELLINLLEGDEEKIPF